VIVGIKKKGQLAPATTSDVSGHPLLFDSFVVYSSQLYHSRSTEQ
jgi:hypothetical protein